MFASCMLRSGTIPTFIGSDRGAEFKNHLMAEYTALMGLGRRFGTAWRHMEQGLVEVTHQETQRVMGILVKDVVKCFPYESGELLCVVEFIVYNTPGAHGFTPRDIDRRWSLANPLERALQPFAVQEWEPVTDYVGKLFSNYRDIWYKVVKHIHEAVQKRIDLDNRCASALLHVCA